MREIFRQINIKNTGEDFRAELYRNRHEKIDDIPNDYIGNVKRQLESITEFEINIPKYIQVKDKKKITPLYMKIKPMQHVIVTTVVDGIEKKERFVLIQPSKSISKNNGSKTFKAMSFEYTLKRKRTSFEGKVIQLKKDDVHIAEGVLDKFARETGWGVDYVDQKSRTELMSTTEKINVDLFKNYNKPTNVTEGELLFEKDITTTIDENRPLYISFEYSNFKTYDNGKLLINTPTIYNTLTDALYTNIKKVQAYHHSDVGNRYGIKYVFTLTDNTRVERIAVFTNIINKTFSCENIRLTWETGNIIETENVKYINIENLDMDWYEALRSLQDNFKSVFLFDSYNKTVSVVHRDNLGEEKPYILTYDNAIIDINVTENSDYVTGLKVMGKNGLSIVSENIYGDDIVRNYSEYIRLGNMSDELQLALKRYETLLTTKQQEWLGIKNNVITEKQKQVRIDSEVQSLQLRVKDLKSILADYMSKNDTTNQARIKGEIDGLESRLNQCLALRLSYTHNIENLNNELMAISSSIDRKVVVDNQGKIFTDNDLDELNDIEQFGVYEDDYYSNSFSLLNASKKVLEEMIKPQLDFDINCVNLCKVIQNKRGWNYILELGSLFKFDEPELKEELGEDIVRFIGYEYEPKTNTISNLIFTNKTHRYNVAKSLADLGKKANSSNNLLNSLRPIIDDAMLSNNFVGEVLKNGLDLSAYIARGRGISNFIDISEAGIYLYDQSDMNKCLYIGSGLICISTDGFASSKTAISPDGIFAENLWGEIIFGEKLIATSDTGAFEITGDGLTIYDEFKRVRVKLGLFDDGNGNRKAGLTLYDKTGRSVVLDENGIIQTNQYIYSNDLDSSNPLEFEHIVDEGVYEIRKTTISLAFKEFRATVKSLNSGGSSVSQTSSSGGGYTGTSGAGGYYYDTRSTQNLQYNSDRDIATTTPYAIDSPSENLDYYGRHYHYIFRETLKHWHDIQIEIPLHEHSVVIPDHRHSLTIDTTHNHTLVQGIYLGSKPSNCSLYVNDVLVRSGINSDITIDIKNYLTIGKANKIKITSSTLGRLQLTVFSKMFVGF